MKTLEVVLREGEMTLLRLEVQSALDSAQLLEAMKQLTGHTSASQPAWQGRDTSKKYRALTQHLNAATATRIVFSFAQLERLLNAPLPASARAHRAWWANSDSHSQARAWMAVHWQMESVDLKRETVTFIKEG